MYDVCLFKVFGSAAKEVLCNLCTTENRSLTDHVLKSPVHCCSTTLRQENVHAWTLITPC